MTTEPPPEMDAARTTTSGRLLAGAAVATLVVTGLLALIAHFATDAAEHDAAVRGALVGGAVALSFFAFGSFSVNLIARVMPAASLIVALMTYVLQVVMVGAVFLALEQSGVFDSALDDRWVAAGVIVGTFAWMVAQIIFTMKARIPVYELPADAPNRTESEPREVGAE